VREHQLRIGDRSVLLLEGPAGWGECSLLPGYPCDPARARAAAEEAASIGWPALVRDRVEVNALVDAASGVPADLGVRTVKVKVGRSDPAAELGHIARLRARLGPAARIRLDANSGWDVPTAVRFLGAVVPHDIEFVEQPVAALEDLARVREATGVAIAADEAVRSVRDAERARELEAADVLVLKIQPVGGVRRALAIADAARLPVVVTSMFETSIGLAAGLALACGLPEPPLACGLATLDRLAGDVVAEPLAPVSGVLRVPPVFPPVPDPALLDRYRVAV
jgi:O-succinylbenzoate synthase